MEGNSKEHDSLGRIIMFKQGKVAFQKFENFDKLWNLKLENKKIKPYYFSPAKIKYFNYPTWTKSLTNLESFAESKSFNFLDENSKIELKKTHKLIEPEITVLNLNNYLKLNDNDGLIEKSPLFRNNLDLFIKYQKNMVSKKIGNANSLTYECVQQINELLIKYLNTLLKIKMLSLRNEGLDSAAEEVERLYEDLLDYEPFFKDYNLGYDYDLNNKLSSMWNGLYSAISAILLTPPAFLWAAGSMIKNNVAPIGKVRVTDIRHYKKYFKIKKLIQNINNNFINNSNSGLKYNTDEYLKMANIIKNDLKEMRGSRYYYDDNYLMISYDKLLNIPSTSNEFVVFSSHSANSVSTYYSNSVGPHGFHYPFLWRTNLTDSKLGWQPQIINALKSFETDSVSFTGANFNWDDFPIINLLWDATSNYNLKLLNSANRYIYADDDVGNYLLNYNKGSISYSEMKYYRKNTDNTWNVYRVAPTLQLHNNIHGDTLEHNAYTYDTRIDPKCRGNYINPHWFFDNIAYNSIYKYYHKKSLSSVYRIPGHPSLNAEEINLILSDSLNYVVYLDEVVDNISMVNNAGYITKNPEGGFAPNNYMFKPHFKTRHKRDNKDDMIYSSENLDTLVDNVYEKYIKPITPFTRTTGILMDYISWSTPMHTINYPFKNILTFK